MPKKLVIELRMYTDGDWGYDKSIFEGYTSKYFENGLYEYTEIDEDYTTKIRRVFDYDESYEPIKNLIKKLCDSLHGRENWVESVIEFFDRALEELPTLRIGYPYCDFMDSNTEMDLTIAIIESDAKPIDKIIYKEG